MTGMPRARPTVIVYPANDFLPDFGNFLMTEDFGWAMWQAIGSPPELNGAVLDLVRRAVALAKAHQYQLPDFPEFIRVEMPLTESADPYPVPLLLGRDAFGTPILAVLSDACPDCTD